MNKSAELKLETIPLWINGCANVPTDQRLGDVYNPAAGHVVRRVPYVGKELVDAAVRSAVAALPDWRDWPPVGRGRVLQRFLQLLDKNHRCVVGRWQAAWPPHGWQWLGLRQAGLPE